jgi:hypothetical protein
MTLPRLAAITERWSRIPPLTVSVANIAIGLGVHKPTRAGAAPAQAANDAEMGDLIRAVGGVTEAMPGWLKAGLDG